jgi:hypothetical protein
MGKFCNKKNPYVQLFLFLFCYLRHLVLRKKIRKPTNKIIVASGAYIDLAPSNATSGQSGRKRVNKAVEYVI